MWEDEVDFDILKKSRNNDADKKSIENHCKKSDYIYTIHFVSGQVQNFSYTGQINEFDAVSININKIYFIIKLNLEATHRRYCRFSRWLLGFICSTSRNRVILFLCCLCGN